MFLGVWGKTKINDWNSSIEDKRGVITASSWQPNLWLSILFQFQPFIPEVIVTIVG
jgi:hypothetical protein